MIAIDYDRRTGIVTSISSGVLTVDDIRQAALDIRRLMQQARQDHGRGLYLVDARASIVQTREIMEEVERHGSYLTGPQDRMAIIVPSVLTSMQSRRVFNAPNEALFQSMEEAIVWLAES